VKTGEKLIWGVGGLMLVCGIIGALTHREETKAIPFYEEKSPAFEAGRAVFDQENCRGCHTLWSLGNMPGPSLDGLGEVRSAAWLETYLSAKNPQEIVPSHFQRQFKMPSYRHLSNDDMDHLIAFLTGLRVHPDFKNEFFQMWRSDHPETQPENQ